MNEEEVTTSQFTVTEEPIFYLATDDGYDNWLQVDEKYCFSYELRLLVDGREFYLSPDTAKNLKAKITEWEGRGE